MSWIRELLSRIWPSPGLRPEVVTWSEEKLARSVGRLNYVEHNMAIVEERIGVQRERRLWDRRGAPRDA